MIRAAAVSLWITGIGFGVFCPQAIVNVAQGRPIPRPFGFPAYGEGPFEAHGIPTTAPLLAGFLLICILEVVAGALLWAGHVSGAILALVLLLPGAIYWWGFALPIPPVLALARTVLIIAGWRTFAKRRLDTPSDIRTMAHFIMNTNARTPELLTTLVLIT